MLAFISLDWLQHASGIVMDFLPIVWLFLGWMCLRAFRRIVGGKSKSVSFSVHDGISKGEWDEFKLSVFAQLSALRESTANQLSNFQHRLVASERDVENVHERIEKFLVDYKDDKLAFRRQQERAITTTQDRVDARFKVSDEKLASVFCLLMAIVRSQSGFNFLYTDVNEDGLFSICDEGQPRINISGQFQKQIEEWMKALDYKDPALSLFTDVLDNRTHICEVDNFIVQMSQVLASQDRLLKQVCELPHVGPLLSHKLELEVLDLRMKPIREALAKYFKDNPHLEAKEPYDPKDHKDTCNCDECMVYRGQQLIQSQFEGGDPKCGTGKCPRCDEDEGDCWCDDKPTKKKPLKKKWPKKLKKKAPREEEESQDADDFGDTTSPL